MRASLCSRWREGRHMRSANGRVLALGRGARRDESVDKPHALFHERLRMLGNTYYDAASRRCIKVGIRPSCRRLAA